MGSVHRPHDDLKGTYLFDGCERCDEHSRTLYDLDDGTIKWLAERAEDLRVYSQFITARTQREAAGSADRMSSDLVSAVHGLSMNERRAITHLRLYARLTFRSQITEEAAN